MAVSRLGNSVSRQVAWAEQATHTRAKTEQGRRTGLSFVGDQEPEVQADKEIKEKSWPQKSHNLMPSQIWP